MRITLFHLGILTSSGTARILVKPFLKVTKTLVAPHLRADVAQSKAVSPAPSTNTLPLSIGREQQHDPHMPVTHSSPYCTISEVPKELKELKKTLKEKGRNSDRVGESEMQ